MKISKNNKILIVGLGLIGGSYAKGFIKKGFEVGAIDVSEKAISFALNNGIISHGKTTVEKDYVSKFDTVIFAVYPHVLLDWISSYQDFIKPNVVLTDVTGVKKEIVYKIQSALRNNLEFVGAHPMAGKEVGGVENASEEIFENANYIVTPTEKNTEENIEFTKSIGEILGFRRISVLSPEEHDEMIGFLSQLTHCIAVSLMTCKDSKNLVDYTGDSFRDLTRIAKINENMWSELFLLNKDELLSQMDIFMEKFTELKKTIEDGDTEKMKEIMRLSTTRRKLFDK